LLSIIFFLFVGFNYKILNVPFVKLSNILNSLIVGFTIVFYTGNSNKVYFIYKLKLNEFYNAAFVILIVISMLLHLNEFMFFSLQC
jgi:hypothetical protein